MEKEPSDPQKTALEALEALGKSSLEEDQDIHESKYQIDEKDMPDMPDMPDMKTDEKDANTSAENLGGFIGVKLQKPKKSDFPLTDPKKIESIELLNKDVADDFFTFLADRQGGIVNLVNTQGEKFEACPVCEEVKFKSATGKEVTLDNSWFAIRTPQGIVFEKAEKSCQSLKDQKTINDYIVDGFLPLNSNEDDFISTHKKEQTHLNDPIPTQKYSGRELLEKGLDMTGQKVLSSTGIVPGTATNVAKKVAGAVGSATFNLSKATAEVGGTLLGATAKAAFSSKKPEKPKKSLSGKAAKAAGKVALSATKATGKVAKQVVGSGSNAIRKGATKIREARREKAQALVEAKNEELKDPNNSVLKVSESAKKAADISEKLLDLAGKDVYRYADKEVQKLSKELNENLNDVAIGTQHLNNSLTNKDGKLSKEKAESIKAELAKSKKELSRFGKTDISFNNDEGKIKNAKALSLELKKKIDEAIKLLKELINKLFQTAPGVVESEQTNNVKPSSTPRPSPV